MKNMRNSVADFRKISAVTTIILLFVVNEILTSCGGFAIRHFFLSGFAICKYWQLN